MLFSSYSAKSVSLFLLGAATSLYLQIFVPPATPIFFPDDHWIDSYQVRFIMWLRALERVGGSGDHLAPLRACLRAHYHAAYIFPGSLDEIWERNP
ncbi:MAG: hypothetical protein DMG24_08150 [Acidobacteria bacterium]|nr:MAG: hypothetical protein DMG24_08150 [Acidobacteriota bacterium]